MPFQLGFLYSHKGYFIQIKKMNPKLLPSFYVLRERGELDRNNFGVMFGINEF